MAILQHSTIRTPKLWTGNFSCNISSHIVTHYQFYQFNGSGIYFQNMHSQTSTFKIVCCISFLKLTFCKSSEDPLRHQVWSRSLWCFPCLHQTVKKQNTKYRYFQYFTASNYLPLQNPLHAAQHGGKKLPWHCLNTAKQCECKVW